MLDVTIGFSLHRTEMVPLIAQSMRNHDALFLEEPPTEEFSQMLHKHITVEEYLFKSDAEFPKFTALMCSALRELHTQGKNIILVEPYLENLLELHSFLAEGYKPEDLDQNAITYLVYLTEKKTTGALLSFYQAAASASFDVAVEAVKRFAQADAERFRLRDSLRAQELSFYFPKFQSSFVEAGLMHFSLQRLIRQQMSKDVKVQAIFLADDILRDMGHKSRLYGPGDQLTLLYIFNPNLNDNDRESLLAARSLIYSKIVQKEEVAHNTESYPHIRDELLCINVIRILYMQDCRRLYDRIRGAGTYDSRQIVADYVKGKRPEVSMSLRMWRPVRSNYEELNEHVAHTF